MVRKIFRPEWRTQSRAKRRFYARYMGWLERTGFLVALALLCAFAYSFVYKTEDWISAEDVPIEAAEIPDGTIQANEALYLARKLVQDGEDVAKGQPVAEVYLGAAADLGEAALRLDDAISEASEASMGSLVEARKAIPVGSPALLKARADGVAHWPEDIDEGMVAKGAKVFAVLDYTRLVLRPSLAGKSVAQAAAGQEAKLTLLKFNSPGGTVFRGHMDGKEILSRNLLGEDFRAKMEAQLKGLTVAAREDVPLRISGVDSIEIEGSLKSGAASTPLDPSPVYTLKGTVATGEHVLSAQASDLPPTVRQSALENLKSELASRGLELQGNPIFVLKLKANGAPEPGKAIPAASLKRSFEAEVVLEDVPKEIVERIRTAHRQFQAVTAKVQVRTGTRALASLLLRRS